MDIYRLYVIILFELIIIARQQPSHIVNGYKHRFHASIIWKMSDVY